MPSKQEKLTPTQARRLREAIAEEEAAMEATKAQAREYLARMQTIEKVVETLTAARLARGLSGAETARRMGVDRSLVSRLEAAPHSPTLDTILAYAKAIGTDVRIAVVDEKTGELVEAA
ncbi:MAG: helix-turn-helix transcriptional regulator [Planctomycetota bacterium]